MPAQFTRLDAVRAFELAAGVSGQPLFGEGAMLNLIRFEPGATVPLHSHPHEQLGIVLEGMQALVVDGVAHELGPFEAYVLPGGVEHSAYCGPEGAARARCLLPGSRGLPRPLGDPGDGVRLKPDPSFNESPTASLGSGFSLTRVLGVQTPAGTPAIASVTSAHVVTVETFCSA